MSYDSIVQAGALGAAGVVTLAGSLRRSHLGEKLERDIAGAFGNLARARPLQKAGSAYLALSDPAARTLQDAIAREGLTGHPATVAAAKISEESAATAARMNSRAFRHGTLGTAQLLVGAGLLHLALKSASSS